MATIFTVHGTNDTGPEEGTQWWQRGSEFERDVRALVEAEDGELRFQPLIWNAFNSEASRRSAGSALYEKLTAEDNAGRQYCAVGHSHGGSVIAASLMEAAYSKRKLPNLSRWITVGTPFIGLAKNGLLFSRLSPLAKTIYIVALVFGFWTLFLSVVHAIPQLYVANGIADATLLIQAVFVFGCLVALAILFGPLIFLHVYHWMRERRLFCQHSKRVRSRAGSYFRERWTSLRHENDEAIEGLRSIKSLTVPIFSRTFLVGPVSEAALIVIPVLMVLTTVGMGALVPHLYPDVRNYLETLPGEIAIRDGMVGSLISAMDLINLSLGLPLSSSVGLFGILIVLGLMAWFFVILVGALANRLSFMLSGRLDRLTWQQVRQSALGADVIGELGVGCDDVPGWLTPTSKPLPADLARELSTVADKSVAQSISKLRSTIQLLAFSEGEQKRSDVLSDYLTWNELIHTVYFKVPAFRKLICYCIATAPGFRPSEAFKRDPDFERCRSWLEAMQVTAPDSDTTPVAQRAA